MLSGKVCPSQAGNKEVGHGKNNMMDYFMTVNLEKKTAIWIRPE